MMGKRGPARTKLGVPQLDTVLGHLEKGHGRSRACLLAGVGYKTFSRRMAEDAELRERVRTVEAARVDDCFKAVYDLLPHKDAEVRLKAINVYLSQMFKVQEARRAVAERKEAMKGLRADSKELVVLTDRIAKVIVDYVPEERREEALLKLEELDKEIQAMVG